MQASFEKAERKGLQCALQPGRYPEAHYGENQASVGSANGNGDELDSGHGKSPQRCSVVHSRSVLRSATSFSVLEGHQHVSHGQCNTDTLQHVDQEKGDDAHMQWYGRIIYHLPGLSRLL